jgi:hypothetical protein
VQKGVVVDLLDERAAFTVSRPIPLLAPTISTLVTVSMLPVVALGASLANERSRFLS